MDAQGYPDEKDLDKIRQWDAIQDAMGLIDFVKQIWWSPDWGFRRTKHKLELHTGGWSGNESIIEALMGNKHLFWSVYWQSSRRGGHYYFDDSMVAKEMKWR